MFRLFLALVAVASMASCGSIRYQDKDIQIYKDLEVKYVVEEKVLAHDVQGVAEVLAKYNIGDDEIHIMPRNNYKNTKEYVHAIIHELIHWTGRIERTGRFNNKHLMKDIFMEEMIAEFGTILLLQEFKMRNLEWTIDDAAKYLSLHPLRRFITIEESAYAWHKARIAVRYIKMVLRKNGKDPEDINLMRTLIVNVILGLP